MQPTVAGDFVKFSEIRQNLQTNALLNTVCCCEDPREREYDSGVTERQGAKVRAGPTDQLTPPSTI